VPPDVEVADAILIIHSDLGYPDKHSSEAEESHHALPEQPAQFLHYIHRTEHLKAFAELTHYKDSSPLPPNLAEVLAFIANKESSALGIT
jgi:N-dimethylarginine dimethylaminohydrolase